MSKLKEEKGFALALVLLITTLIVILTLEFNYEMRVDTSMAVNYMNDLKALYTAKSGVNVAISVLMEDWAEDEDDRRIDSLDEKWATKGITLPLGDGVVTGSITDECGKINLNEFLIADDEEGKKKGETMPIQKENVVRRILDNLEVNNGNTDEIITSIMDWTGEAWDEEEEIETYYESLPEPYESKLGWLEDITELLLVKGINKNIFYQIPEDADSMNLQMAQNIAPEGRESVKAVSDLFTVYSKEKGKVNINTAPREVLLALHENMDEESVDRIIERRNEEPFESIDDLRKLSTNLDEIFNDEPKGLKGIKNLLTVRSSYFSINVRGRIGNVTRSIDAIVYRDESEGSIKILSWAVY